MSWLGAAHRPVTISPLTYLAVQTMYTAQWTAEKGWDAGALQPYGPITVMPSAQVLNYGQAIFEGMKAQHTAKGRVVVFRPDQNAARFKAGAARMSMPAVPEDQFVEAVKAVVRANVDYVSRLSVGGRMGRRTTACVSRAAGWATGSPTCSALRAWRIAPSPPPSMRRAGAEARHKGACRCVPPACICHCMTRRCARRHRYMLAQSCWLGCRPAACTVPGADDEQHCNNRRPCHTWHGSSDDKILFLRPTERHSVPA